MTTRTLALATLAAAGLAAPLQAQCELAELTAASPSAGAGFGSALAVDGDFALVGAPFANGTGAAYVFERSAAGWQQVAVLTASDAAPGDLFGSALALSGGVALVGAPGADAGGLDAGAAYAFEPAGGGWTQTAKLGAPLPADFAEFGSAVTLWFDFAMVGAPGEDGLAPASGAVHFFLGTCCSWTQFQKLMDPAGQSGDRFGAAVELDVGTAVIGAPRDDGAGPDAGALHLFQQGAISFFPFAELVAPDASGFEELGRSVAVDGARVIGGAPFAVGAGGALTGAAYVFDLAAPPGSSPAKLVAADGVAIDGFGAAVDLSGMRALVGAPQNLAALAGEGRAHTFQLGGGGWVQTATLSAGDGLLFDHTGGAVALHPDELLVGAAFDDSAAMQAGSVHPFSTAGAPEVHCTAKTTSSGCLPRVSASGAPSASAASGFVVRAGALEPGNVGIFFYGTSGPAAVPFQGGFLCVAPPVTRTPAQSSGGAAPCTGSYAIDFNAWIAGGADPQLTAGVGVDGQFWFRDPPEPQSGTGLSDAISFALCP